LIIANFTPPTLVTHMLSSWYIYLCACTLIALHDRQHHALEVKPLTTP
jgi:hypothetical protein